MNRRFLQVLKFRVKKLEEFSWRVNHLFYSSILNCTFSVLKCIFLNSYVFGRNFCGPKCSLFALKCSLIAQMCSLIASECNLKCNALFIFDEEFLLGWHFQYREVKGLRLLEFSNRKRVWSFLPTGHQQFDP